MKRVLVVVLLSTILIPFSLLAANLPKPASPRERLLMDFGWQFHLGDDYGIGQNLAKAGTGSGPASTSFSDKSWRTVNLPHDWAVELPFDQKADGSHGFKALGAGFPQNNVGWYRRAFALRKSDSRKRLWLEFDGVFRDCTVFLNGWFVGHHESGYSSFRYDITDIADCGGTNVLAVRVDASEAEGWFYEGAGIYRHVWLVKTAPVAVAPDTTFVFTEFKDNVPSGPATVHITTRIRNSSKNAVEVRLASRVFGPDGATVASRTTKESVEVAPSGEREIKMTCPVPEPVLWSPESPKLYRVVTDVQADDKMVDHVETEFGIRTVAFDAEKGFLLNGKPYVIKGTCNHQDHAGVGSALPDGLQYFRIARLKDMGCNAYRTSHNPPTPELLEACDRLGMLVMDENRLLGSDSKHMDELERLILRDRNHPSVAIWSIANEEYAIHTSDAGGRVAATMQTRVKELDPTRPVTYAANNGNVWTGVNSAIEVRGWNYYLGETNMDAYHRDHPLQPNIGTEQGSTVSTRGIYANDKERGYVSAYDENFPPWAATAKRWWGFFAERPWLSGAFVWTGFDYRGEPTPYEWPCINSHFGILDMCGFPKDNFWFYQAWWADKPMLHLLPHWNWAGKEGQEIDVRALSNCDEVELFLNGQSLGKQTMPKNSELKWSVKYAPGVLSAKGFKGGKLIVETKVETTGEAASVQLEPDRATLRADGEDVSVITVSVRDAQGRIVPVASNLVEFQLEGAGKIIGVGNGDPSCHEPDVYLAKLPLRQKPVDGWRWQETKTPNDEKLPAIAETFDDSSWTPVDVKSESGPLSGFQHGIFRARFTVTDADLTAEAIELCFGRIDENGRVYVNGQKVGASDDWRTSPAFDVKRLLHAGQNTVCVTLANYEGSGGVNNRVNLQFQEKPEMPQWKRSVFNGLAQIIVQAGKQPGVLKLTARAKGLQSFTLSSEVIQTEARPAVE
jgi:beta-galactosidase